MNDNVVATIAIVFIFSGPISAWLVIRSFKHQERMERLKRGMMPPPEFTDRAAYRAWRRAGTPWPPQGAPQQQQWAPQPPPVVPPTADDDPQRALYKGIRLALIGF